MLGNYFRSYKYTSFLRQLELYQFKREKVKGAHCIVRHHIFRRDNIQQFPLIQRRPQYRVRIHKKLETDYLESLIQRLETNLVVSKGLDGQSQRMLSLFKYMKSFQRIFGKSINSFIRRLLKHINFFYPNLLSQFSIPIEKLRERLGGDKELDGAPIEQGIDQPLIKELTIDLLNEIIISYHKHFPVYKDIKIRRICRNYVLRMDSRCVVDRK